MRHSLQNTKCLQAATYFKMIKPRYILSSSMVILLGNLLLERPVEKKLFPYTNQLKGCHRQFQSSSITRLMNSLRVICGIGYFRKSKKFPVSLYSEKSLAILFSQITKMMVVSQVFFHLLNRYPIPKHTIIPEKKLP